ncbi:hypothetical protein FKM82_000514 [Ascaphus truei]
MVILLTDGEPTEGEVRAARIQANVRRAVSSRLSLYCLGFGRSVDYSLLQTLALENGGAARQIYEDSDTDLQLRGFYDEVARPLLTGVQVAYPENAVSHLTRRTFQHYYGGSEIVLAGRIEDNALTELPSEITARGVRPTGRVGVEQSYIFGEYTERLWAYLTIQQLLEEQILASGEEKARLKSQALDLSLKYNLVTPLSSMVVTKPEGSEGDPSVVAEKPTEGEAVTLHAFNFPRPRPFPLCAVDGDPHFIVRPPGGNETLCFNVQQRPGVFLNLVEDPETGDTCRGAGGNTYIGRLGLQSERLGVKVEVTMESITITSGAHESVHTWNKTGTQTQSGLTLSVLDGGRVTVTMEEAGTFVIVLHRPLKKSSKHSDYLGLYTEDSHWLSNRTRGILGQFYSGLRLEISAASSASGSQGTEATLSVRGNRIKVSGQWRRDFHTDAQRGEEVFCWFVRDGGKVLMDGREEDFLVSGLYEHLC